MKAQNSPRTGPLRKGRRAAEIAIETPFQCRHSLVRNGGTYLYVVTVKRKMNAFGGRSVVDFVVSDILHLSSQETALQSWDILCQLVICHDGSHAVTADKRFFDKQYPKGLHVPHHSYFMNKRDVSPRQIDSLDTKIAFLDERLSIGGIT